MRNTRIGPTSTILFDAGNTLAFVDLARIERTLAAAGAPAARAAIDPAERAARAHMYRRAEEDPGLSDRERWTLYLDAMVAELGVPAGNGRERIRTALEETHRRENLWRRVERDTPAVLDRLAARGFRLGVVSNADGRVRALLREIALASHFELVVDSHEVGVEKPDPRIFEPALRHFVARPEHAVYVGDFPRVDVVGARAAGIRPVLLDSVGIARGDEDYAVITRLAELEDLLPPSAAV